MLFSKTHPHSADEHDLAQDRLLLMGCVDGDGLRISHEDCRRFPREDQIPDVGAYAPGLRGQGVRLAAIMKQAGVLPAALYMNLGNRNGTFAAALFRTEIEKLGIIVYALDDKDLAREEGGPFLLALPGFHDECRAVHDVAWLDFSNEPGVDMRRPPSHQMHFAWLHLPCELVAPTARSDSFVIPPAIDPSSADRM